MARVVTVLRSGGEFNSSHVRAMKRQVERWAPPGTEFECISDVPIEGVRCWALQYDWPGWWAKLELFRPDIPGDFLFTDLDNVILGPLDDILKQDSFTLQHGGWTALMTVPAGVRARVWNEFTFNPVVYMSRFRKEAVPRLRGIGNYGDAGFISWCMKTWREWEKDLPGQAVNLAALKQRTYLGAVWFNRPPIEARIVLCGQPYRPWTLPMFKHLYGESI
jgi:hypothetical protein